MSPKRATMDSDVTRSTDPWAPVSPGAPGASGAPGGPRVPWRSGTARPPAVVVLSVLLALAIIAVAAAATLPRSGSTNFDPTGAAGVAPVAAAKSALGLTGTPSPATSTPATSPTTAAGGLTTAAGGSTSIQAELPIIEQFVEADRGLTFKSPVKLVALSDADFRKFLASAPLTTQQQTAMNNSAKELQALGLIPSSVDLTKAEQSLESGSVVGLYDPTTKALYVRGTAATPYVRQVMAHELTHALQDQWFGLNRLALDSASDESGFAFSGLIEGDARRVEDDYVHSLSAAEQREAAAEEEQISGSGVDPSVPQVLVTLAEFPYIVGPQFVGALLQAGGQARLDQAFRSPPTTSRQLLNPMVYLAGQGALPVAPPPADGPAFDHTVLGEIGLILLLNETIPAADARGVADLWGGDSMIAWQSGSRVCVRDRLATVGDPTLLSGALLLWAKAHPGASVSGSGPFVLTSCA